MQLTQLTVVASLILAIAMTIRIWTSDEHKFFKIGLTAIVFIPVLGPLAYLWISRWPSSSPPHLQSDYRGSQLNAELERLYAGERSRAAAGGRREKEANQKEVTDFRPRGTVLARLRDPSPPVFAVILILGAMFLAHHWLMTSIYLGIKWPWGYPTFWGGSVGTILMLAMLLVATPLYFWYAWKKWPTN